MPKPITKKPTDVVLETVVSTPVVNAAPAETKVKKTKAPKVEAESVVVAAPVVAAPVVAVSEEVTTTTTTTTVVDVESMIVDKSNEFLAKLNAMGNMISSLKTEYRTLEKVWTKELRAAQKLSSKKKRKAGNRAPSGFVKPTRISDELAKFLGKPDGSEMARTDVTREINTYIRAHSLQDKENGRKINPDTKLAALLKLKKTDELTYFNLQKFMSPHFAKGTAAPAASITSAPLSA
jgi:upstream activation factor subunit UAF30